MSKGLSPAIAIEQKAHAGNPRSTVGTMTEIYDYLRILYARIGIPHCPETGEVIKAISKEHVVDRIMRYPEGEKIQILAPIEMRKNEKFEDTISRLQRLGFLRIRLNGEFFDLDPGLTPTFDRKRKNELYLVIDRLNAERAAIVFRSRRKRRTHRRRTSCSSRKDQGDVFFNLAFAAESTGKSYPEITPHTFAFNNAEGMCLDCQGLGYQYGANLMQNPEFMHLPDHRDHQLLWREKYTRGSLPTARGLPRCRKDRSLQSPLHKYPTQKVQLLLNGSPSR